MRRNSPGTQYTARIANQNKQMLISFKEIHLHEYMPLRVKYIKYISLGKKKDLFSVIFASSYSDVFIKRINEGEEPLLIIAFHWRDVHQVIIIDSGI